MGTTIVVSIVVFLFFTLLLVSIILFAKAKLSPSGKVKVVLNGEKTLEVDAGGTVLAP